MECIPTFVTVRSVIAAGASDQPLMLVDTLPSYTGP